jgi:soluble lytic murein transglycosylase-like protein
MADAKRKLLIAVLGACVLGAAIFIVLAAPQLAEGNKIHSGVASTETTSSPSPTPSPSATPLPPASKATVKWAKKQRNRALYEWVQWNKARKAYKLAVVPFLRTCPRSPARLATENAWLSVGKKWKRQALTFHRKYTRLRHGMLYPGGSSSGYRWQPLARWVGFPEYALPELCSIITRESSGRATAYNPSGASGLLQLMPGWYHGAWGPGWDFNPFDPEANLKMGLWIYNYQHHSFLPAWSLTAY